MMDIGQRVLTESEFCEILQAEFAGEIEARSIHPEAHLIADLALDSLDLIRLAAVVESLAPIELPDQLDPFDARLADVYHYYSVIATRAFE